MSRPTAPELLEAASRELRRIRDDNLRIDKPDFHTMTGAIEELERRLSLAQTEINGHVRTIDDLKADLADEAPARFRLQDALKRAQDEWQKAQARIAELEKVLVCAHALCDEFSWSLGMDDSNPMKGTGNRLADAVAALKSRA